MEHAMKKENKKIKKIMIILAIILIIGIVIFFVIKKYRNSNGIEDFGVPVQSVAVLVGADNTSQNRFSGVVESQNTVKIQKQSDRTVKQVYVEVGETVKVGQKLFEYDTDDISTKIEQENLEVERMQNAIQNYRKEIDAINSEKAANPGADHSEWNLQIQTDENEIRQTEYNIKSKNVEINKLKKQLKNVVVTSEIDGIVQSINDSENTSDMYGNSNNDTSYMTIMQTGAYRVKGTINEQNIYSITPGDKVIVHSRVDDKTWTGTIDNIDTSNPETSNNNVYYYGMDDDSMSRSSKYPFYINLDSIDGLMLGQHVYIERNVGQDEEREGLWIPSYFIVEEEETAYIWIANSRNKLEKKKIKIGEKDEELEEYQILEGLTIEDYIAIPDDTLKEGKEVTKYDFIPLDMNDELYDDITIDEMFDEEAFQEEISDDAEVDGE